jgi:hypothetical protein
MSVCLSVSVSIFILMSVSFLIFHFNVCMNVNTSFKSLSQVLSLHIYFDVSISLNMSFKCLYQSRNFVSMFVPTLKNVSMPATRTSSKILLPAFYCTSLIFRPVDLEFHGIFVHLSSPTVSTRSFHPLLYVATFNSTID